MILSVTSNPGEVLRIWDGEALRKVERERSGKSRRGRVVILRSWAAKHYSAAPHLPDYFSSSFWTVFTLALEGVVSRHRTQFVRPEG